MKYLLIIPIILIIIVLNLPEKDRSSTKFPVSKHDNGFDAPTQKGNRVQKAFMHGKNRH